MPEVSLELETARLGGKRFTYSESELFTGDYSKTIIHQDLHVIRGASPLPLQEK